jgi:radical SAM superfamily enzyme YgiQ (UPF0313 family)
MLRWKREKPVVFPLVLAESESTLPYLSIGMVVAAARAHNGGELARHYSILPLTIGGIEGHPLESICRDIESSRRPICLFSSYTWNHALNIEIASRVKEANPGALVVFGGPEVPSFEGDTEAFFESHPFVDIAVLGEGEVSFAEILGSLADRSDYDTLPLDSVDGIVFRSGGAITRTKARERKKNIDEFPSPYLSGEFGDWFHDFTSAILETNRGCPYGCTYCDWGSATLQKVAKFSPERVISEIEFIAERRCRVIFIADANFGMLEQDIAIAEALVATARRTGYPKKVNTNFAKNGGRRLLSVIKILHEGGLLPVGIIALQTTDIEVLRAIKRDNIKTSTYEKMMEFFNSEKIPMSTDLMIGLPGQNYDSLVGDIQYCFDWKVSANGNFTSMMPNAPMAERNYRAEYEIKANADGLIVSTSTFTEQDMERMKSIFYVYQFHVRLGVFKYALYHLQIEHGLQAMQFLNRWQDCVLAEDARLPLSRRVYHEILQTNMREGDWVLISWKDNASFLFQDIEAYYRELFDFIADEFGIVLKDSVVSCLTEGQAAVMPRLEREYPWVAPLEHDLVAYFDQVKAVSSINHLGESIRPLDEFPASQLPVTPRFRFKKSIQFTKVSGHMDDWELPSPLRFYSDMTHGAFVPAKDENLAEVSDLSA